jgi:hypothetical protein
MFFYQCNTTPVSEKLPSKSVEDTDDLEKAESAQYGFGWTARIITKWYHILCNSNFRSLGVFPSTLRSIL